MNFKDYLSIPSRNDISLLGESYLTQMKVNDIIQLTRRGFYRIDQAYDSINKQLIVFKIPDGKITQTSAF